MILPDYSQQHLDGHLAGCEQCRDAETPDGMCSRGAVYLMVAQMARRLRAASN